MKYFTKAFFVMFIVIYLPKSAAMDSPYKEPEITLETLKVKAKACGESLADFMNTQIAIAQSQIIGDSPNDSFFRDQIRQLETLKDDPVEYTIILGDKECQGLQGHSLTEDDFVIISLPFSDPEPKRRNSFEAHRLPAPLPLGDFHQNLLDTLDFGQAMEKDSPNLPLAVMQTTLQDLVRSESKTFGMTEDDVMVYFTAMKNDLPSLLNNNAVLIDQVRQLLSRTFSLTASLAQNNPILLSEFAKIVASANETLLEKIESIRVLYGNILNSQLE
jgi:hypothetical protein